MKNQQRQDDLLDTKEAATIKAYFEKQLNTIETILKKRHRKVSKEDIHKLRVAVKKIKCVSALVLFCEPDFRRKKFMKWFKKIFTAAGKLRELQLEISRLKKLQLSGSLKDYQSHMKKLLKKKKDFFFSLANGRLRRKLKKRSKMIYPFFEAVNKIVINKYLEEKTREITSIMESKNLKEKEAHRLRKLLKEFYYSISIFGLKDKQFKNIAGYQELLGQWHNDVVLVGFLEKAIDTDDEGKKELKIIKDARNQISSEGKMLFEKIKAGLQSIDSSLLKFESRGRMLQQPGRYSEIR
jgi:CHAD domain-containing protein